MLDERHKNELWQVIRRMDRTERRRLLDDLARTFDDEEAPAQSDAFDAAVARMRELRRGARLGDLTIAQLIEEGRRY